MVLQNPQQPQQPQIKFKRTDRIAVMGTAEQGKTTLAKFLLSLIPIDQRAVYDFVGDMSVYKGKCSLYHRVMTGEPKEAEDFMRLVYKHRGLHTGFDEADNYFTSENKFLRQYITTVRNPEGGDGGFTAVFKRPMAVRPESRSNFSKLFMFKDTLPDNIEYLEKWTGLGSGSLEKLRELNVGEFYCFDLMRQTLSEKMMLKL